MDALHLLEADHRAVEKLFREFEKAGGRAFKTKRDLLDSIIRELSVHAAVEEEVFYPAARRAVSETNGLVLESIEEHHIVKWLLSELEDLDPEDETFQAKVTVLIENVRHHVDEEESELFPQVQKGLKPERLEELGADIERAKATAPTHPHPRGPAGPPTNLVANAIAGVSDAAKDMAKDVLGRGR